MEEAVPDSLSARAKHHEHLNVRESEPRLLELKLLPLLRDRGHGTS